MSVTPRSLGWKIGETIAPKICRISVTQGKPIHVTKVVCTNNHFSHELKTVRDGLEYELVVTPNETSEASFGILKIYTDSKASRYSLIQAFANVRKDAQGN